MLTIERELIEMLAGPIVESTEQKNAKFQEENESD